jgi:hypothetical protein
MDKIKLKDDTEIQIQEGASPGNITVQVDNFADLGTVAESLLKNGNQDEVQFLTDDQVTGRYINMKLETPLFRYVDVSAGRIQATFGIRQKTEIEIAIEELRKGQTLQDGAIADLGDAVSTIAEGGEV